MADGSAPRFHRVEDAIETLYGLNVGAIGSGAQRHERPHKPILLLAVLDAIAAGQGEPDRILWSQDLRNRFTTYFERVRSLNDNSTPENPFYYLRGDGFWEPLRVSAGAERPLETTPTVADAKAGAVFARLTDGFESLVLDPSTRTRLRDALVSRYFPAKREALSELFLEKLGTSPEAAAACARVNEDPPEFIARSSAFRRLVREAYDSQCAACGLRIKLPDADLTFIDGAHLIPFSETYNDHPTNGIALCKNHHWAMDRHLIAPSPEGNWLVSPRLDARRSNGECELCDLRGKPLLPPHDDAYRPDEVSLEWRATAFQRELEGRLN